MKFSFDEQAKKEAANVFGQTAGEMSETISRLFDDLHSLCESEGYRQYSVMYEKFRDIHSNELKAKTRKLFDSWKASDASFRTLLTCMKAAEPDTVSRISSEFEAPLEEILNEAFRTDPPQLAADDTVHLTRSVEENNRMIQDMMNDCFDSLDEQIGETESRYGELAFENQMFACIGVLASSQLKTASGLYDLFRKAAEEVGVHLEERAHKADTAAENASVSLGSEAASGFSRLDGLYDLFEV